MVASNLVLITGAGDVGRTVLELLRAQGVPVRVMVRRDDERAAELRAVGAEVVLGDLTRLETVAAALESVGRMYFAMPVSPDHLLAATVVAAVAKESTGNWTPGSGFCSLRTARLASFSAPRRGQHTCLSDRNPGPLVW